ncbi:unnamed protein product [Clonostachys byssicola]|uniref:Phenylacetaldoxime dehydratase n=1 Tax=Clonostachys byssicola TaxID=160290 RepID=A0A9N9Y0Z4_9HYPO|nr:unnamed protein product [Clonostachys byssicola]
MSCPARLYPLRKPKGHKLPIPRWKLVLDKDVSHVFTAYIGIQQHSDVEAASRAKSQATAAIQAWLKTDVGPSAFEKFSLVDGCDVHDAAIWVCYWTEAANYKKSLEALSLPSLYSKLEPPGRTSIGLWREAFTTEVSRLETNYSGLNYLPGLARMPDTSTTEHDNSAYWGAARDRIPDSAHDLFPPSADAALVKAEDVPRGLGQYLVGTNLENVAHIRSGQYWENCAQDEADAYERKLEPTLHAGLSYLWENQQETGAQGLRYLRNKGPLEGLDDNSRPPKETCGAGFFTSLEALETWAKTHRSHLAIYRGALSHYKAFEGRRELRTWHEVSVLRSGDAKFEYLNCVSKTGVIQSVPLEVKDDSVNNL